MTAVRVGCASPGRRRLLGLGGLTLFVSALDPALARTRDGAPLERLTRRRRTGGRRLVYIFQRFGADGLNTVIPVEPSEHALYRSYRPLLGIDRATPGMVPLDGDFALHPVLERGLGALWLQGQVAVLPNVGYPDGSRSHFDSQRYLETGTPHDATTPDGWLNRYLQAAPANGDPLRAVALAARLPVGLVGPVPALAFSDVSALRISADPARHQRALEVHGRAYALPPRGRRHDAEIAAVGSALVRALRAVGPALPAPSVAYPAGDFGRWLSQLASLIRSDLFDIEVAEVDLGGWDHHANQQDALTTGRFPGLLSQLSDGIAAFVQDLGPARMADTVLLTASEFGRTARENGSRGTDHGSAWAGFVIGPAVRGGVYFGPAGWHGLSDLRDGRDLRHSLDFRDVCYEVVSRHLGVSSPGLFPGWTARPVGFL